MCRLKAVLVLSLVLVVLCVFAIDGISCAPKGVSCAPKPAPLPTPAEPAPPEPTPVEPTPPELTPVELTPPEPTMHTWTLTDAEATRLLCKPVPGSSVHFMPENKAKLKYSFIGITAAVGVSEGRLWLDSIPALIRPWLTPIIGSYTSYSEGKLFLTELPPWFDPTEEIAPDVTELPTLESITTAEGKAIITYVWP